VNFYDPDTQSIYVFKNFPWAQPTALPPRRRMRMPLAALVGELVEREGLEPSTPAL
jgi:hypothetical protein